MLGEGDGLATAGVSDGDVLNIVPHRVSRPTKPAAQVNHQDLIVGGHHQPNAVQVVFILLSITLCGTQIVWWDGGWDALISLSGFY